MTADHAGQTGGEREDAQEAAVAIIRTWIDRHPRPQYGDDTWWPDWAARNFLADPEVREHVTLVAPSRPVPVPGQAARESHTPAAPDDPSVGLAAREAAVEAAARDVMPCPRCASPLPGRCERTSCPQTEHDHRWTPWRRVVSTFAYDRTEVGTSIAELNRTPVTAGWSRNCSCGRIESSTGDLAALSAAPGQEQPR